MKTQRVLWVVFVVMALALISCASSGKQFDRIHVNDIQTGVHDKAQIKAWFGEPGQIQSFAPTSTGCVERWIYVYARSTHGGAKTKSASLVVDFNKKGKVCDHAYVENK